MEIKLLEDIVDPTVYELGKFNTMKYVLFSSIGKAEAFLRDHVDDVKRNGFILFKDGVGYEG